eukprot:10780129-Ditylum_brightwellii.AAC.1
MVVVAPPKAPAREAKEEINKSRGSATLQLSYKPGSKLGFAHWEEWTRVLLGIDDSDTAFNADWSVAIYPDLPVGLGKQDKAIKK